MKNRGREDKKAPVVAKPFCRAGNGQILEQHVAVSRSIGERICACLRPVSPQRATGLWLRRRRLRILATQEVVPDASGDPRRGVLDGIPRQMSVPGSRLNLGMAEQLSNHRETLAQGQRPRSIGVPYFM